MLALRGLNFTSKSQSHFELSFPLRAHIWQPGTSYDLSQSCQNSQFFLCLPHSTKWIQHAHPHPGLVSYSPFPLFPPPPTSSVCPHPKSTSNQFLFLFSPGTALAPATASLSAGSNSHVFQVLRGSCSTQNIWTPPSPVKDPICPSTVTSNHCPSSIGSGASSFFSISRTP